MYNNKNTYYLNILKRERFCWIPGGFGDKYYSKATTGSMDDCSSFIALVYKED